MKKERNQRKYKKYFILNCKTKYKKLIKQKKIEKLKNARNGRTFWRSLFYIKKKKRNNAGNDINLERQQNFLKENFDNKTEFEKKPCTVTDDNLDKEITIQEIKNALKSLKNNKSAGCDEINNEFLKVLPDNCLEFLKEFFNQIYNEQQTPGNWSKILVTMIHKKGKKDVIENYRPIALINCLAKVFTAILKNRLEKWLEEKEILIEEQSGFRKKRGCRDNIFVLDKKLFALLLTLQLIFPR